MATKRIIDLTSTATSADLRSSRYGVLDTPGITKKLPGNLLGGGGGSGNGIEYIDVATTMTDILSIIDNGKLPVMREIAGQGYDYYYPSWVGSGLTFVCIGQGGVKVKIWNSQSSGWTDVAGYDTALSSTSSNAVQNKAVDIEFGKVGGSIAPRYDSTKTYSVGEYVMYARRLYVCNTAINTAEEWDHTKWTQTDVADIIGDVETLLAAL